MLKILVTVFVAMVFGFAGVTYVALESGDVLEVETSSENQSSPRMTHIWFVHTNEGIFLEAGNPQNPWVQDLTQNKTIRLVGDGIDGEYSFRLSEDQSAHEKIRSLMREKYGWRDFWISAIFNVDESAMLEVFPKKEVHP